MQIAKTISYHNRNYKYDNVNLKKRLTKTNISMNDQLSLYQIPENQILL